MKVILQVIHCVIHVRAVCGCLHPMRNAVKIRIVQVNVMMAVHHAYAKEMKASAPVVVNHVLHFLELAITTRVSVPESVTIVLMANAKTLILFVMTVKLV